MHQYEEIYKKLEKYNQEHLLAFYSKLSEKEKEIFLEELNNLDLELIKELYDIVLNKGQELEGNKTLKPLLPTELDSLGIEEVKRLNSIGLDLLKEGKVAALVFAGGQGTRLSHDGPKGTFDLELPSHKSLFQLQCEKLINLSNQASKQIPWYIMTSPQNHEETVAFFKKNNYFGYSVENIFFFKQSELPLIDEAGKIVLESYGKVNAGANGNGGIFISAKNSGVIEDMRKRSIEWVHLFGIDNALVKVADPVFLGFTYDKGVQAASKAVNKAYPEEKVGVICFRDEHPDIVEYTELPKELTEARDNKGELLYRNANILSHVFTMDYFEKCASYKVPYHVAYKKVDGLSQAGVFIAADKPNGYKFELFIFDVFKYLSDMAVLTVLREEEFAPVKNKTGVDSKDSAREMIFALHKKWLSEAKISEELFKDKEIEISPLISYNGENLSKDIIL